MVDDLIGAASLDLILHPVADTASLVRTLADITPEQAAYAAKARHVAVEGYSDCRVFASEDGVLVVRSGFEHLSKGHTLKSSANRSRRTAGPLPKRQRARYGRLTA